MTGEWHSLCDKCGDLLIMKKKPTTYQEIYCANCNTIFPDGLQDSSWGYWPDPSEPEGCA